MSSNQDLRHMIDAVVEQKADANRRYIDQVLEKIQDQNHQYFLERLGSALREEELARQSGNMLLVTHHKTMAEVYRSLLQQCFPAR